MKGGILAVIAAICMSGRVGLSFDEPTDEQRRNRIIPDLHFTAQLCGTIETSRAGDG